MLGLLVAGVVIGVAGLLSIAYAIPMKEFSLGNTLIVSGVIGGCAGAVLVAAWMLLRELRIISQLLAAGVVRGAGADVRPVAATGPAAPAQPAWDEAALEPPAWAEPPRAETPDQASAEPEPPARKRRNLLFMSTRRAGASGTAEGDTAATGTAEAPAPAASFEDAWPAERPEPAPARQAPPPSRAAPAAATRAAPPLRRATETQEVTVLKSGVVDGMAYSLYSDGSIEAQLPEGMIRFASIDELRHHLDQRGG